MHPNCRHVWIATPPRTGSTWAFNVVRHSLLWHGIPVQHNDLAKGTHGVIAEYGDNMNDALSSSSIFLYKIHAIIHQIPEQSKFITIFRNPIEVIASFMRFSKCDFETAFSGTQKMIEMIKAYQKSEQQQDSLVLQYADITEQPTFAISQILSFLDIPAPPDLVAFLEEKLEKRAVARAIKEMELDFKHRLLTGANVDQRQVIQLSDQTFRTLDLETGFQSGHISTMSEDDYIRAFTPEQMARIHDYYGDWVRKRL